MPLPQTDFQWFFTALILLLLVWAPLRACWHSWCAFAYRQIDGTVGLDRIGHRHILAWPALEQRDATLQHLRRTHRALVETGAILVTRSPGGHVRVRDCYTG